MAGGDAAQRAGAAAANAPSRRRLQQAGGPPGGGGFEAAPEPEAKPFGWDHQSFEELAGGSTDGGAARAREVESAQPRDGCVHATSAAVGTC